MAERAVQRDVAEMAQAESVYHVEIRGLSPLLMHRFSEEAEASVPGGSSTADVRPVRVNHRTPREEAETSAYRLPDGRLYMPSTALQRAFVEAAGQFKQRGSRQSLKWFAAAAFTPISDVMLFVPDIRDFEVDSRPVVNPSTKGRVMRHRPRIEEWTLAVDVEIDETLIAPETVLEILNRAGRIKGIGDFRPEHHGPFGRFQVSRFEPVKDARGKERVVKIHRS